MDDDDFLVLQPSQENDPSGKKLAGALHAHIALERQRVFREALVYAVALLGIVVWPLAAWPMTFPSRLRGFVLALFAMTFALLLLVWWKEHAIRRERARLSEALRGTAGPMGSAESQAKRAEPESTDPK